MLSPQQKFSNETKHLPPYSSFLSLYSLLLKEPKLYPSFSLVSFFFPAVSHHRHACSHQCLLKVSHWHSTTKSSSFSHLESWFHGLLEFDQKKRSCRRCLSDHNPRRHKLKPVVIQFNSMFLTSSLHGMSNCARQEGISAASAATMQQPVQQPGSSWATAGQQPNVQS
ncbi:Squamosa promoter-binding-like protein 12 [Bienertia sinuspersici]